VHEAGEIARCVELVEKPGVAQLLLEAVELVAGAVLRKRPTTASAASMPLFMAVWLPLIFTLFSVPALQPMSRPPGNCMRGSDSAALGDRPGAVTDALAALEVLHVSG
jgi:hypothetical protein